MTRAGVAKGPAVGGPTGLLGYQPTVGSASDPDPDPDTGSGSGGGRCDPDQANTGLSVTGGRNLLC